MPTCVKCQALTTTSKRCTHCLIGYCSKACRSADWSRHKSECKGGEGASPRSRVEEIHCGGHACARCGKCCDWQFEGDLQTWCWIQNYKNWNQAEKNQWNSNDYKFTKRRDATCFYQFSSPHYDHYIHFYGRGELGDPASRIRGPFFDPPPGCLCDSNYRN